MAANKQYLSNLDVNNINLPRTLSLKPGTSNAYQTAEGETRYTTAGDPEAPAGFEPVYDSMGSDNNPQLVGYRSTKPVDVNGVPVMANYDASGNLQNYISQNSTEHNGRQITTAWDANGNPHINPIDQGGNFLSDLTSFAGDAVSDIASNPVGQLALLAAAYYGGPAALEALSSGAAATAPEAIKLAAPEISGGLQTSTAFDGLLPAGSAYVAPEVTTLGTVAGDTAGMAAGAGAGTALGELGSGTYAAPGDLGTEFVTQGGLNPAAQVGQITDASLAGAGLSPGAIAGTGAAGLGLLGAATTSAGDLVPATMGLDAGTAAAGAAAGAGANALADNSIFGSLTGSPLGDMAAINAGSGLVGGLLQSGAAKDAAQIQSDAAAKSLAQQQANFDTINKQQAPYRAAGYTSLNNIANLTTGQTPQYDANGNVVKDANGNPVMNTGSGYLQHQFDANDLKAGLAPNYDFMLNQGQMTNQRAANLGGGAIGGNALQGLNKYTQDYAGNAYQNAFTNYQNQRSNIYNTLASIAGIGQTGQNATNTAATNATNNATNLNVGSAAANAAGTVGSANAYSNALGNAANSYTLASLLNQRGNVAMPSP